MYFRYLQIVYCNILIVAFILLNMPILSLLLFALKPSYLIWKLSFEHLFFLVVSDDENDMWLTHVDYDTDSNYYFKLLKGEFYLWYSCYFIFDKQGGQDLLHDSDFLDIIMYKMLDKKNFRYIYKSIDYKIEYNKNDYFYLYQYNNLYKKNYNLRLNIKFFNEDTFNILTNLDKIDQLKKKKKYYYYKKC